MQSSKNPSWLQRLLKKRGFSSDGKTLPGTVAPERRIRPRFGRSVLAAYTEKIAVRIKDGKQTIHTEVYDLSPHGMSFRGEPALSFLRPGSTIDLVLTLGENEHAMTVEIVNKRRPFVGGRIVKCAPEWADEVGSYLDPLEVGQRLYEIHPRLLQNLDPSSNLHWFQAAPACDLFYWTGPDKQVLKAQLFYASHVVEWTPDRGFRTGEMTVSPVEKDDRSYPMSKVYDLQFPPDEKTLRAACRLVLAARVPEALRKIFKIHA